MFSTKKTAPTKSVNLSLPPQTKLGRYTIVRRLASGGFGVVYIAIRDDGERVAIKEFLPSMFPCRTRQVPHMDAWSVGPTKPTWSNNDSSGKTPVESPEMVEARRHRQWFQEGLTAFFREADTLSKLHLPKVIQVWDVFEAHGTAYFVMPLEEGSTLRHWMLQTWPKPSETTLINLMLKAADGVHSLHEHGLLHLDLKPGNLWVRPNQDVIVLDLGVSRWQDEAGRLSHLARTPGFAAPEQHSVKNIREFTIKTDIYALTATLWCGLEGHKPAPAPHRSAIPYRQSLAGRHADGLLRFLDKGMAIQPAHRHDSVLEWKQELQQIFKGGCTWSHGSAWIEQDVGFPGSI